MSQGDCPCCKGENLNYGSLELEGDQAYYKWTCQDCGAQGEEWYSMEFIGHYNIYDKEGNEIKEIDLSGNKK